MRHILVADDDPFMVQTLCDVLSLHGWTTHGVGSGEEVLRATAERDYRCVIMDIKMEGEDGFSAMQRIKRRHASTPVFLMTAYTAEELVAEARRNGSLQTIQNNALLDDTIRDITAASRKRAATVLISHQAGFVDNVAAVLEREKVPFVHVGHKPDLLAEFEREPPTVALIAVPCESPSDVSGYLITGLDAGVWVALSHHRFRVSKALSECVAFADGFFRKPLAIPSLVEQLNAVAVA